MAFDFTFEAYQIIVNLVAVLWGLSLTIRIGELEEAVNLLTKNILNLKYGKKRLAK